VVDCGCHECVDNNQKEALSLVGYASTSVGISRGCEQLSPHRYFEAAAKTAQKKGGKVDDL